MRYDITVANTIIRGEAQIRGGLCIDYGIHEALYLGERYFPAGQLWTLRRDRHDQIVEAIEEQHRELYGDDNDEDYKRGDEPDRHDDRLQGVPAILTSRGGQPMSDAAQGPDFDTFRGRPVIVLYTGREFDGEPERVALGYRKAAAVCDQIGHIRAFVERCKTTGDDR